MKDADITAANRRKAVNGRKTMQREEKTIVEKWEKGRLCPFPGILEALGVCPDDAERISVAEALFFTGTFRRKDGTDFGPGRENFSG